MELLSMETLTRAFLVLMVIGLLECVIAMGILLIKGCFK